VAVGALEKEMAEISGETFAQPQVMPVRFGDRIAEPLVGDLVRIDVFTEEVSARKTLLEFSIPP